MFNFRVTNCQIIYKMHQNLYKITPFFLFTFYFIIVIYFKTNMFVSQDEDSKKKKKLSPSSGAGRHKYLMIIRLYVSFH